jgi:hypothetical protein
VAFCLIDGATFVQFGEEISFVGSLDVYALAHFGGLDGREAVRIAVIPPPEGAEDEYVRVGFVGIVSWAGQDLFAKTIVTRIEFAPHA